MPIYEYQCDHCGPFEARVPMADYARPADCPDCAAPARRVLLTPPRIAGMTAATRRAHEINERSADSPRRGAPARPAHAHAHPHRQVSQAGPGSCTTGRRGAKGFPGRRPWMISH